MILKQHVLLIPISFENNNKFDTLALENII